MQKQLTKHGNSYALVIDKPIMDLLGIDPETPLGISTDGVSLVITPIIQNQEEIKFQAAFERAQQRFGRSNKKAA